VKPARLRPAAQQDLVALSLWSADKGGAPLAARVFDAARAALKPIQRMSGLGAPALAESVGMPGLWHWGVDGFAVRWFYLEREDHLDVLRLLGERQSMAAILAVEPSAPR
jgi:toxin ParE1/3/4